MDIINNKMIHHLAYENKEIILVGTAHVSKESADLVAEVIEQEKPDSVCVELCDVRYESISKKNRWKDTDIIQVIKDKKAFLLLSNLILASFQKRIAKKLGVTPGQEIIQAIESGKSVHADIYPVDRDIRTTFSRTWRAMGFWSKIKLMFQLVLSIGNDPDIKQEDIERMKQEDVIESVLAELGKSIPVLEHTVVDERDQYLSEKIRNTSGNKIVAVVGAGHVAGIKKYWNKDIDIKGLETVPPKSKGIAFLKWLIPISIVMIFISGFFYGGAQTGTHMVKWWIAVNGILAGIGAIAALAHPLTILSSIIAAPLTSLNPMLAVGWVCGLVEAFSRKPKVKDFENLPEDIISIKGFWKNKVSRILLVMVFTNLGSAIGTFVAIPLMVNM